MHDWFIIITGYIAVCDNIFQQLCCCKYFVGYKILITYLAVNSGYSSKFEVAYSCSDEGINFQSELLKWLSKKGWSETRKDPIPKPIFICNSTF